DIKGRFMRKCNLCYDRTSQGKGPMCATVCPTQAIFYGTYEEWLAAGRALQSAKPVNTFYFGRQRVRTRNYVVMTEEDEDLDILALVDNASLGVGSEMPRATASRNADQWVGAETAGIPERPAPAQPWTPRQPQPFEVPVSSTTGEVGTGVFEHKQG
ncbi:MAG TPA: 4Fe-4S dicluster domain-containing protein, partial [Ktedonobacteraceae bacterium]|nr:4Fe-4S dicluster domain-containing protein [Ktedonobacteraceae bacterium]